MCSPYANVVYPNRSQGIIPAIGHDDVALLHEGDKVVLYPAAKGRPFLHAWLIDKNGASQLLNELEYVNGGALAEVVRTGLHSQAVDAYDFWSAFRYLFGNELLSRLVGGNDGLDEVLGNVVVVAQQLL